MKIIKNRILLFISISLFFSLLTKAQDLFVGPNYHPHDDKNLEKIKNDIQQIKAAGFNVVRMGYFA